MHVGNGGFRAAQASIGSVDTSAADASYCRQRWGYYDPAARKYMGDDGEWRPCSAGSAAQVAAATGRHTRKAHRAPVSASQQFRNANDYLEWPSAAAEQHWSDYSEGHVISAPASH
jgi:hypothetical protein